MKLTADRDGNLRRFSAKLGWKEYFDPKEIQVLSARAIPMLIPPMTVQGRRNNIIQYDISDYSTLEFYLTCILSREQFAEIMLQCLETFQRMQQIYLSYKNLVLDLDKIYIMLKDRSVHFIYLPLVASKHEVSLADFFRALIAKAVDRHLPILPTICGSDFSQIRAQWLVLIDECHHAMLDYSAANCVQLGTTVSTFFAYSDHYITLTIGDSRIYERTGRLTQLTQDQSLVAREIVAGRISEEESRHHPQRNILLQCVGVGGEIVPAFTEGRVRHDALYLLCSDGFVHELSPEEIGSRLQATLLNSKDDLTHALCDLTELCKGRGETDNITAVLVKASESKSLVKLSPLKNLRTRFRGQKDATQKEELVETAQIVHTQEAIGLD